jgi:hypothetical protein
MGAGTAEGVTLWAIAYARSPTGEPPVLLSMPLPWD